MKTVTCVFSSDELKNKNSSEFQILKHEQYFTIYLEFVYSVNTFNGPCNAIYQFVLSLCLPVSLEGLAFLALQSHLSGPSDDKEYRKYDI